MAPVPLCCRSVTGQVPGVGGQHHEQARRMSNDQSALLDHQKLSGASMSSGWRVWTSCLVLDHKLGESHQYGTVLSDPEHEDLGFLDQLVGDTGEHKAPAGTKLRRGPTSTAAVTR